MFENDTAKKYYEIIKKPLSSALCDIH